METNKLLTLEEIEVCAENLLWTSQHLNPRKEEFMALLATARAYWEMFAIYNDTPTVKLVDIEDMNNNKLDDKPQSIDVTEFLRAELWKAVNKGQEEQMFGKSEDKPHPATLKVIVEALKEAQGIHTETARSPEDIGRAVKSLEKHLE